MAIVSLNEKENEEVLALQQQLQRLKELFKVSLDREVEAKKSALSETATLYSQFDILKARYTEAQVHACALEQEILSRGAQEELFKKQLESADESLKLAENNLSGVQADFRGLEKRLEETLSINQNFQQQCAQANQLQEEGENKLKTAHYHLAKKVRENAELADKLMVQETKLREMGIELEDARDASQELQFLLDQKNEKEKQLQVQSQEALLAAEALAGSWEEKYHKIYEKIQEYELRLKEQENLEEKFHQMKTLWNTLGGFFDDASKSPKRVEKKAYQNLFSLSEHSSL